MWRNRMLVGASFLPFFAPDDGSGGGAPGATAAAAGVAAAASGAAAAAPPPAAVTTLADDGSKASDVAAAAAANGVKFPENWREEFALGDKDAAKDLAKYENPKALYKSLRDLQGKISKGELKPPATPFPATGTAEQQGEWRKTNGLPDKAESYVEKLSLPDGVVIGEADKPLVADFAKSMFEAGASQAEMNRAVSWFYKAQESMEAQRADADGALRTETEVSLRTEWGPDFKPNMNAFGAFKATMPEDMQALLFSARTADGRMLGNTAEFLKLGAQIGRELNPTATLILPTDANAGKTIDTEIATIEKSMYDGAGNPNGEYWKGEAGAKMQARYRELLDVRERMKTKGQRAA